MASSFDRWEKDPFFSVAEEVQESADRMESTYRTWIHAKKDPSSIWNAEELRRDLHTTLGTAKWQLEEFERAVTSSYVSISSDDARDRHKEFIVAISSQISKIQSSLQESTVSEGKASLPWVRLDEGECNELALFLTGPPVTEDRSSLIVSSMGEESTIPQQMGNESLPRCPNDPRRSTELLLRESREVKLHGHRRTASASADIGAWEIAVADGGHLHSSPFEKPEMPPRKVPSFSGLLSSMESASKLKWPKNGFRKWKITYRHQETDTTLLQPPPVSRGINACYERSKRCLDSDCYEKQLYGWYGAIQRQLQRSQYQMQYSRPIQMTFWILLILCLIGLLAVRAI